MMITDDEPSYIYSQDCKKSRDKPRIGVSSASPDPGVDGRPEHAAQGAGQETARTVGTDHDMQRAGERVRACGTRAACGRASRDLPNMLLFRVVLTFFHVKTIYPAPCPVSACAIPAQTPARHAEAAHESPGPGLRCSVRGLACAGAQQLER